MIKKIIYILFSLMLLPALILARTTEGFESFSTSDLQYQYYGTAAVDYTHTHSGVGALGIKGNGDNSSISITIKPSDGFNFSGGEFLVFWIRDLGKLTGHGMDYVELGLLDAGNENWKHAVNGLSSDWMQVVIPLVGISDASSTSVDGFALPAYVTNDSQYGGDKVFSPGTIGSMVWDFGRQDGKINTGSYLVIDDIQALNTIEYSIPFHKEGYITYMDTNSAPFSFTFGPQLDPETMIADNVNFEDVDFQQTIGFGLNYSEASNRAVITPSETLSRYHNYSIEFPGQSIRFFGHSIYTKKIILNTSMPTPQIGAGVIQDAESGSAVWIASNSLDIDRIFSVETIDKSELPGDLKYQGLAPADGGFRITPGVDLNVSGEVYLKMPDNVTLTGKENIYLYNGESYEKQLTSYHSSVRMFSAKIRKTGLFVVCSEANNARSSKSLSVIVDKQAFTPNGDGINDNLNFSLFLDSSGYTWFFIYDASGRVVRKIYNEKTLEAGSYSVPWDGKDEDGNLVTPGIYVYELKINEGDLKDAYPKIVKKRGAVCVIR